MAEDNASYQRFLAIGLAEKTAKELSTGAAAKTLNEVLDEAGVQGGCDKSRGSLLYTLSTTFPKLGPKPLRAVIARYIASGGIRQVAQVQAAVKYAAKAKDWNEAELKETSGFGSNVGPAEVKQVVAAVLKENDEMLRAERYHSAAKLMGLVRGHPTMKWAEGGVMKEALDEALLKALGPKTAEDEKPLERKAAPKKAAEPAADGAGTKASGKSGTAAAAPAVAGGSTMSANGDENFLEQGRALAWAVNTDEQLAQWRKITHGQVRTRFPPEPNGYLHLGHAKAMHFNFKVAKERGGITFLRFDDTNPSAEKLEYIDNIIENVRYMGHEPAEVRFSSDYFDQLYDFAIQLIKQGDAYVCHLPKARMEEERYAGIESPYRNRSVEENLRLFEDMRRGKFDEGECCLRMKGDMKHHMTAMRDLVAYRIQYRTHPHAGDKWCIYPSYDFTHCIIDSLEGIKYSLCTLEFEVRRESYFWLLDRLNLYKPVVWEYSRLNILYNVMSKRKLKALVDEGLVRGWDDPRLITLNGLRRRGYTALAINSFCEDIGVSRTENTIDIAKLEFWIRKCLNDIAPRRMVVTDPLRVVLENYPEGKVEKLSAPSFPIEDHADRSTRELPFSRVVYIDRNDFKLEDEKGYYRLAPGKTVHLRYAYHIKCTNVVQDAQGNVVELRATVDLSESSFQNKDKVKGILHWVADPAAGQKPLAVVCRLYEHLFAVENPGDDEKKDWRADLNPNSETVVTAFAEPSVKSAKVQDKFQFERLGYFCVDKDSTADQLVFNRTVTLRDTAEKEMKKDKA